MKPGKKLNQDDNRYGSITFYADLKGFGFREFDRYLMETRQLSIDLDRFDNEIEKERRDKPEKLSIFQRIFKDNS